MKIAVLDDYQDVAKQLADWTPVTSRAEVTFFTDHVDGEDAVVARLTPFEVVCVMRERTPMTRAVIERLPNLKLIVSTGKRNAAVDSVAAAEKKVLVGFTGYDSTPTIEHTWALIFGLVRHIAAEANAVRTGGWQHTVGENLNGKTLALLGLGNIGSEVAKIARVLGMNVIAWSQNLTVEKAKEHGAELVTKEALFERADILSVHLVLSGRSRGLVDAALLASMKPTAYLVNTSRGPIVDEAALIEALKKGTIAGAAVDVFEHEPLPPSHPFRSLERLLVTPHIGYVTKELYRTFYGDTVKQLVRYLNGEPLLTF